MTGETTAQGASEADRARTADLTLPAAESTPPTAGPDPDAEEARRLAELYELDILDTPPEQAFDDLVLIASQIAGVPMALVTLIDAERQWFKAKLGLDIASTDRDVALCDHVIRGRQEIQVADARVDPRFRDNPAVASSLGVAFYAGFPLTTQTGSVLGTLCVMDQQPHELSSAQQEALRALARQVMSQLKLRRSVAEQAKEIELRQQAQAAMSRSEQRFRSVFDGSPMGIALADENGIIISVNPTLCRLTGCEASDLVGRRGDLFNHPDDGDTDALIVGLLEAGAEHHAQLELRFRRGDGEFRWAGLNIVRIDGPAGEAWTLLHLQDVTERRRADQALADSEANLTAISRVVRRIRTGEDARESIVHAVVDIGGAAMAYLLESHDADSLIVSAAADPAWIGQRLTLSGTRATARVWRTAEPLFVADVVDHPQVNQHLVGSLNRVVSMLWQPVISDGRIIAILVVTWTQAILGLDDRKARAVALLADEAAVALEHDALLNRYEALAGTDSLTGLPNRRSWDERLAGLIANARRTGDRFIVAVADVDRFKVYNDTFGHLEGDALLREIGQAARQELRAVDIVARWGGEEFAIALPSCDDTDAPAVLERIRRAVPRGQTLSIGYTYWDPESTAYSLMIRADSALYAAKRNGRDQVIASTG